MNSDIIKVSQAPDGYVSADEYEKLRKEFEEFVYIISHDLQAPLRHAREFNKLLLSNMGDDGNQDQLLYINNIQLGVNHAEAMIDGMLKYSRLNTQADIKSQVDLNRLIENIKQNQSEMLASSLARIEVDNLPEIYANEPQIEQLFTLLIENSIKFPKKDIAAQINISAELIEGGHKFTFSDNGMSINAKTRSVAFEIFRPIRKFNQQSGIGIGLTMAKKIVESHGGEIWIDPNFTAGTKIEFTLSNGS